MSKSKRGRPNATTKTKPVRLVTTSFPRTPLPEVKFKPWPKPTLASVHAQAGENARNIAMLICRAENAEKRLNDQADSTALLYVRVNDLQQHRDAHRERIAALERPWWRFW